MTITQITVRITDDIPSVVTPVPPMVNQNDRYELIVEHDGSYDGGKAYDMVRHFTDGTELATTRESYYGDDIILPVMRGRVVSVADEPEFQDGAFVLPVHLLLADERDERIVYLNASKRAEFPQP